MSEAPIKQMQELLQKSLIKIKTLEAELETVKNNKTISPNEDIAIIGYAFRFPNQINTLQKFWELLIQNKETITKIPASRFDVDEIYSEDAYAVGKTNTKYGSFLAEDVSHFDAAFFGIPPREAKSIDPIQRILLEIVYEAFENAGIPSNEMKGKNVGVYVAVGVSDYIQARLRSGQLEDIDVYDTTGIPFATICGRISYTYDFNGESISVDTACSSAMVALHKASSALQQQEIDMAIVASANLLLTPELFVGLTKLGSNSPSGKTKAFADDADGYVRAEGAAVLLLKRKSDALKNNDTISLLVKGSFVKHNGTSNGFTAPNPQVQSTTILKALENAKLNVDDIDYVESHGIGNKVTDAMEVQALQQTFRDKNSPLYVGSVKSNIGHMEACTGMPMLFKLMAAMQHQKIPAQINIVTLNKDVNWENSIVQISRENMEWKKEANKPRRASINLSGYSGTNVHTVFEEAPAKPISESIDAPFVFNFSAKEIPALLALVQKYNEDEYWKNYSPTEIAYTLSQRNLFEQRLSVQADSIEQLGQKLQTYANQENDELIFSTPELNNELSLCFQFTGQGAQYTSMCKGLYDKFDVYKNIVDYCDKELQKHIAVSIKDILWVDGSKANLIHQTQFTQPCLFVVEYAMAKLLLSFGIQPSVLIGHSIGEITALAVAEVLPLDNALNLVAVRGQLMQAISSQNGAMAAVFASGEVIAQYNQDKKVEIAGYNTPQNTTITGEKNDVDLFVKVLRENHIKAVPLQVSHAFHSKAMDEILDAYREYCSTLHFAQPQIPIASNIDGKIITENEINADYLCRQLRQAVHYLQGIENIQRQYQNIAFIECGPNPVLNNLAKHIADGKQHYFLSAIKQKSDDVAQFYAVLQQLFVLGSSVNWQNLYEGKKINRVLLPNYAWQWKSYWYSPIRHKAMGDDAKSKEQKPDNNIKETSSSFQKNGDKRIQKEMLFAVMQMEAAKILGLEAGQKLDRQKPYREQGFDSMMSGEFLMRMEKQVNAELSMEILHQYNTPELLHRYLIDTYYGGGIVETQDAITLSDIMFDTANADFTVEDWHKTNPEDGLLLRIFKKIDSKLPKVK